MELNECIERERTNPGRVFLYLEGETLRAYELSAYIAKQCFPQLRFSTIIDRTCGMRLMTVVIGVETMLECTQFPLAVNDKFCEMTLPEATHSMRLQWKVDFSTLKEEYAHCKTEYV